jgi:UDP:flavonoid glycosyltransferase YjiC (YdhE family)
LRENRHKPILLIFPFNLLSHYLRCLMLAKELSHYFEILFPHSDKYADFIAQEGFQTFRCKSIDAALVMECAQRFDFSWMNENALEAVFHDQVRIIETLRPIAVLGDTAPTLKMAAEKTGVTYLSLMNGYMSKYYSYTRKLSRTHPVFRLINKLPAPVLDLLTGKGEAIAFYKIHRPFKKIRSAHHLSKINTYLDELEGDVNLVCDLKSLFPLKALPPGYLVIGPLFYNPALTYSNPREQLDNKKQTIFVTMGSSGDWRNVQFLNNEYFARYNVVTAGDSNSLINAPHIIQTTFINIHDLFNVTDLVICQGGNGTIYQAFLYGIPVLCKTNIFEQEWNVEAIERLHAGASLDSAEKIEDNISIISEWITRKGRGNLVMLKQQVQHDTAIMGTVVSRLATQLLRMAVDLQPS